MSDTSLLKLCIYIHLKNSEAKQITITLSHLWFCHVRDNKAIHRATNDLLKSKIAIRALSQPVTNNTTSTVLAQCLRA